MTNETNNETLAGALGPSILQFFGNPWIGIAGALAGLAGVVLAVYFYLDSRRYPEVVCYVNSVQAVLVKQGTASRLAVTFDGRPISQDVTAAQVTIWNRGKQPVRSFT